MHGGDGGDIIAHKDALGIEPPTIKIQIKNSDKDIVPSDVQALCGSLRTGEYGLFITLNNFSKQAQIYAKGKPNLRLIDGNELIDLILEHYEKFHIKQNFPSATEDGI